MSETNHGRGEVMKRFVVAFKQAGQGCDYTIGCGVRVEFVEAGDAPSALRKVIGPDHDPDGDVEMEWVRVCELASNDQGSAWGGFVTERRSQVAAEKATSAPPATPP